MSSWLVTEWIFFFYAGRSSVNYQAQETRSRLSKTVDQVLRDNVAMPYYIQFMESRSADHLVRFWLEAESFRSTSWSRVRAHSLNSVKHSSLAEPTSGQCSPGSPDSPSGMRRTLGDAEADLHDPFSSQPPSRPLTPSPQDANSHSAGGGLPHRNSISLDVGQRPGTPQQLQHSRADTPTRQPSSRTGTPLKIPSTNALRDLSDKLMKSKSQPWFLVCE